MHFFHYSSRLIDLRKINPRFIGFLLFDFMKGVYSFYFMFFRSPPNILSD